MKVNNFISDWNRTHTSSPSFQNAIEWARKTTIEKACEWLKNNWREYVNQDKDGMILFGNWESDFRKAMEE